MLLWSIVPKINWNQLLPTIESKNMVTIMIVSNSDLVYVSSASVDYYTVLFHSPLQNTMRNG